MVARDVGYLIVSKQTLLDLLTPYQRFGSWYTAPRVWTITEGGYPGRTSVECVIAVKLFFLAQFRSAMMERSTDSLRPIPEETVRGILDAMMGPPPFGEVIFDQWWTLERILPPRDFGDELAQISLDQLNLVANTGLRRVDYWIDGIRELKRKGEI